MKRLFEPLRFGNTVDDRHIAHIVNGLRNRSLPKPEWTHGAHLTAGAALIEELGLTAAETTMPGLIRAYNEATGVANTDSEGYHHTITVFYLNRIEHFFTYHARESLSVRITRLLSSPLAEASYPFTYYSKNLLFSAKARRRWTPPDLKALN